MKKFRVYGILSAATTQEVIVEAEDKDAAIDIGSPQIDSPHLCHQCSHEIDMGDIYEFQAAEIED
jgi:hypothetical protein